MTRAPVIVAMCLILGACAANRLDVAVFPTDIFATGQDLDDSVLLDLHRAFNARKPFPTNPREAARLLAEVEYFTGEINAGGRWSDVEGIVQEEMLQGRQETRKALGVAPGARSQAIVDALLAVSRTDDPAAQTAALGSSIFTLGGAGTLARLSAMPPLPVTQRALGRTGKREEPFEG